jgi:hypothetical protein
MKTEQTIVVFTLFLFGPQTCKFLQYGGMLWLLGLGLGFAGHGAWYRQVGRQVSFFLAFIWIATHKFLKCEKEAKTVLTSRIVFIIEIDLLC